MERRVQTYEATTVMEMRVRKVKHNGACPNMERLVNTKEAITFLSTSIKMLHVPLPLI